MGAADKLIPIATTIANNLHGVRYSTGAIFKLPGKSMGKFNNVWTDAADFFASIYAKELKIAESNSTWNYELVNGQPLKSPFSPNHHTHSLNLGMLVAVSEEEWNELQIAISRSFNIVNVAIVPVPAGFTLNDILYYFNLAGIFSKGTGATEALTDANGNALPGSPFAQGVAYANAWNTLKVPADALLGVETPFLAPIYNQNPGTDEYFYRYTGVRRWFGFDGYDLI